MSTEAIETEYDYEGNQYEYALESHAAEVNELVDQMATAWLQMGDKLRAAKAWLRPGQWAGWVRAKCRFSLDTADRMVKTSELIASRPALRELQQLNNAKTIFGILCNPKTPIEAVDEVEAEVKEDGIKSRDDVKEIVAKHAKSPQAAEGDDEQEPEQGGTDPAERPCPNCGGRNWQQDDQGCYCGDCKDPGDSSPVVREIPLNEKSDVTPNIRHQRKQAEVLRNEANDIIEQMIEEWPLEDWDDLKEWHKEIGKKIREAK